MRLVMANTEKRAKKSSVGRHVTIEQTRSTVTPRPARGVELKQMFDPGNGSN